MARVSVKYPCGSKVQVGQIVGTITAVFIRGRGRSYEFSYINDGTPTCVNCEEIELSPTQKEPDYIGFKQIKEK